MNRAQIPNALTILRGFLTLVIILLFYFPFPGHFVLIFILFWVTAATDFLDGYLARKWQVVSDFGIVFDPLFDKIFTLSLYFLILPFDLLPSWVLLALLLRELLVDGLKSFLLSRGTPIPAIFTAKLKMIFQVIFLNFALLLLIFPACIYLAYALYLFAGLALIFALWSAVLYLQIFLNFLKKSSSHA